MKMKRKKRHFSVDGYDIVVFDCDSVLTKIEGIDHLAKKYGKEKEILRLTKMAMEGKIDFEKIFPERLNLIKPKRKDLDWLAEEYIKYQLEDAKEVIKILQSFEKRVFIVTGSYQRAVEKFAFYLGIPRENVFAVDLKFGKSEDYLGFNDKNPLVKNKGKKKILEKLARLGKVLFVGDGVTDLEAKEAVDLFVGFGGVVAREIVQKKSDIFINIPSLKPIITLALGFKGRSLRT